jgi:hypothetical protein
MTVYSMSAEARARAEASYEKAKALMEECQRQGREGYELHGWALDLIERVERQSGKEVGEIFRKAYDDERQYGGRYFVAGVYLRLLLGERSAT